MGGIEVLDQSLSEVSLAWEYGGAKQGDAFSVAEAILTAVDKGSAIINLSLGGYAESQILRNAVEYARDNGVVVVAASGNDGVRGVSYPARFDSVIGVGALTAEDTVASFSNFDQVNPLR